MNAPPNLDGPPVPTPVPTLQVKWCTRNPRSGAWTPACSAGLSSPLQASADLVLVPHSSPSTRLQGLTLKSQIEQDKWAPLQHCITAHGWSFRVTIITTIVFVVRGPDDESSRPLHPASANSLQTGCCCRAVQICPGTNLSTTGCHVQAWRGVR